MFNINSVNYRSKTRRAPSTYMEWCWFRQNGNKIIKRVKVMNSDNTKENKILVQPPKTKSSNRIVPIPSDLIPVLKEHSVKQKLEKFKAGESYENNNLINNRK